MNISEKIQIYIITYNRLKKFKYTLDEILKSPIKDFDITILDNASTDGTSELIEEYCKIHPNIKHVRHPHNIGGNANICRAFEMGASCGKDYFWILCDDDKYDFSNWGEVEERIKAQDDIICLCDYICDTEEKKKDPAYQIFQLTFVPAGIYKSSLITDDILINMYDAIITMFQQAVVTIKCVNEHKKIYVLSKPVVFNGIHFEDKEDEKSLSFKRGGNEKWVLKRREDTSWILGFANIITLLKDKALQKKCMQVSIPYKDICGSWDNFYNYMSAQFLQNNKFNYFEEIFNLLPKKQKKHIIKKQFSLIELCLKSMGFPVILRLQTKKLQFKNFIRWFFSSKNAPDKIHKNITIFGIKINIKRKRKKKSKNH